MDITATLQTYGIRSALIVDDAYELPTPAKIDPSLKTTFVHLVRDDDARGEQLRQVFEGLDTEIDDQITGLLNVQEHLERLWGLYSAPGSPFAWCQPVFGDFEQLRSGKRAGLLPLEGLLQSQGMALETRPTLPHSSDTESYGMVFIDFFLDTNNPQTALQRSIEIGRRFNTTRNDAEGRRFRPLVFLISTRSATARDYQEQFRNLSQIKGSFFRFVPKEDFKNGRFISMLERLLGSFESAMILADYLEAFRAAALKAVDRLEELELTDLSLLNLLRIESESERLGNYLNWLLSEAISGGIQSDAHTRRMAIGLDQRVNQRLDGHIVDPRNLLLDIYTDAVFRYDVKDRYGESRMSSVTFGDVFMAEELPDLGEYIDLAPRHKVWMGAKVLGRRVAPRHLVPAERRSRTFVRPRSVFIAVLTPTSDMIREKDPHKAVLTVVGYAQGAAMTTMQDLLAIQPFSNDQHLVRVDQGAKGAFRIVKWEKDSLKSIPLGQLNNVKRFRRIARFQPLFAHQLKHYLLSHAGRVGVPTTPSVVNVLFGEAKIETKSGTHFVRTSDLGIFAGIMANKRTEEGESKIIVFSTAFLDEVRAVAQVAHDTAGEQDKGKIAQVIAACDEALLEVSTKEGGVMKLGSTMRIFTRAPNEDEKRKPFVCEIYLGFSA